MLRKPPPGKDDKGERLRRPALCLVLMMLLAYAYAIPRGALANADSHIALARAIVDDHTLRIDRYAAGLADRSAYRGHFYTDKAPGLSLLAVPAYALLRLLLPRAFFAPGLFFVVRYLLTVLIDGLPSALFVGLLYPFLATMIGRRRGALLACGYGLGTMVWALSALLFSHTIAAMSTFGAFMLLYPVATGRRPAAWWRWAAAGALCGLAVLCEYPAALVVAGVAAYAAYVACHPLMSTESLSLAPPAHGDWPLGPTRGPTVQRASGGAWPSLLAPLTRTGPSLLAPPAPSGGAWGEASPQTPAIHSSRDSGNLEMGDCLRLLRLLRLLRSLWILRSLHAPRLSITPTVSTNADSLTSTCSTIGHTVCLAGVWGEASPQAPPEGAGGARGKGPAAEAAREGSPMGAGGAREGDFSQTLGSHRFRWVSGAVIRFALFVVAGLTALAPLAAYNIAVYGSAFSQGYAHLHGAHEFVAGMGHGVEGVGLPSLAALWGITFSPYRGLFVLSPFLLLAFPGLVMMWRSGGQGRGQRPAALLCAYAAGAMLLFESGYYFWDGGVSLGPRHIAPALLFLVFPVAVALRQPRWYRVGRALIPLSIGVVALCCVSVIIFLPGVPDPILTLALPHLLHGLVPNNWGMFLGLRGPASLLPLAVGEAALTCILWRTVHPAHRMRGLTTAGQWLAATR